MHAWLLLSYRVPPKPTARRVYVWRKLKRLGAVLLHDAVWALPSSARAREQFQWLAAEIEEAGGEALLWEARLTSAAQDEALARQFAAQADAAYRDILSALRRTDADLSALARQYQQVSAADYFPSALGQRVRKTLIATRGGQKA